MPSVAAAGSAAFAFACLLVALSPAAGAYPPSGQFEPSCTSASSYGWPRFNSSAELAADPKWSAYFKSVYGAAGSEASSYPLSYPLCVYDLRFVNRSAYMEAGLESFKPLVTNTSELKEGDFFGSLGGYGIYHSQWSALPNNSWTEIAHTVYPTEVDGMWVWRTRGSGVWANVGRTIVFPTPADPSQIHREAITFLSKGCSKRPSSRWPQMESDIFGFCAREKGYDSVQFAPQQGQNPVGTFGLPGLTEIVLTRLDGNVNCGSATAGDTLLRSGWAANSTCVCANKPIDPLCGLMAFPPSSIPRSMVQPSLCAAQAKNSSVACNGYRCSPTTCAV